MNYIDIWTDGSYSAKKGGYSFYINAPCILEKPVLVYSFVKVKKSTRVELLSIINAFKYLYYMKADLTNNIVIRIMCDESSIVDAFNGGKYKIWNEKGWRKGNGKPIKSCVNEWFQLTCLVEAMPENKIEFIKVQSKKDCGNKLVDKYSDYARKLKPLHENQYFVLEYSDIKKEFIKKEVLESIDIDISTKILNREKPWERPPKTKRVKWKYNQEDIVYINSINIVIKEGVHLDCNKLTINGMFRRTLESGQITKPIVVRKEGEQFILVSGITRLVTAKLLDINEIPCIVMDLNHNEFIELNTVVT